MSESTPHGTDGTPEAPLSGSPAGESVVVEEVTAEIIEDLPPAPFGVLEARVATPALSPPPLVQAIETHV